MKENTDAVLTDTPLDTCIENVNYCPVCGSASHSLTCEAADWTFGSGRRLWAYRRCSSCCTLFLDPRPSPDHIHLAYKSYYTHAVQGLSDRKVRLKHSLVSEYFSALRTKGVAGIVKRVPFNLLFPVRSFLDAKSRHLGYLEPAALLDFGCGNGDFMRLAEQQGWKTKGYDMDRNAVACARKQGLNVSHGDVSAISEESANQYDLVTLSHVIEHTYEPHELLRQCYRIIKPGGSLWLETPNSRSVGYMLYGKYWRGLEPPRHLCLFNHESITQVLRNAGFGAVMEKRHSLASIYMSFASERIAATAKAQRTEMSLGGLRTIRAIFHGLVSEVAQWASVRRGEFVTVIARK